MKNKKDGSKSSAVFWKMAREYVGHILPDIRKTSPNTVRSYRDSLNAYIGYLESVKHIQRKNITFSDFGRSNLTDYLDWMLNDRKYANKTCNLRLTAIRALLEYAASENSTDLMDIYIGARSVKGVKITPNPIEYFEADQMRSLLAAPGSGTKTDRRNQMMLILYYDTAARISELIEMSVGQLHLNADIAYLTILGKGRKYRNIPLMEKTVKHLKSYLRAFHSNTTEDCPLFYAKSHGMLHQLSQDTVEKMIKKYSRICEENGVSMPEHPHCHMMLSDEPISLQTTG